MICLFSNKDLAALNKIWCSAWAVAPLLMPITSLVIPWWWWLAQPAVMELTETGRKFKRGDRRQMQQTPGTFMKILDSIDLVPVLLIWFQIDSRVFNTKKMVQTLTFFNWLSSPLCRVQSGRRLRHRPRLPGLPLVEVAMARWKSCCGWAEIHHGRRFTGS